MIPTIRASATSEARRIAIGRLRVRVAGERARRDALLAERHIGPLHENILGNRGAGPRPLALALHRALKALHVDPEAPLLRDLLDEIDGKAQGVVEEERVGAADRFLGFGGLEELLEAVDPADIDLAKALLLPFR